jgi:hypothetical protein
MHDGPAAAASTLGALRRMLLAILLIGMTGTAIELLLLRHDEDALQLVPLVLISTAYASIAWQVIDGGPASLRTLQVVMVAFLGVAAVGLVVHYRANVEYQLESDPSLRGQRLLWKVLEAKAPPALAPGVMGQLGLLGLAYAYRHPGGARHRSTKERFHDENAT